MFIMRFYIYPYIFKEIVLTSRILNDIIIKMLRAVESMILQICFTKP
jgi:hypothetical protein